MMRSTTRKEMAVVVIVALIVLATILIVFAVGIEYGKLQVKPGFCNQNVTIKVQERSGDILLEEKVVCLEDGFAAHRNPQAKSNLKKNITEYVFKVSSDPCEKR